MKLILKLLLGIVIILAALIIILPIIFKGEIIDITKKEINKNINATVDFADMDVSLIKNFPNFSLTIQELTIIGKENFSEDTLANIKATTVVIDLLSVIQGDRYEIRKILIDSPKLAVKVLETGASNYDIAPGDEEPIPEEGQESESAFNLRLKEFQIVNGELLYDDRESDIQVIIKDLNNTLSGDFSEDFSSLKTNTQIESLSVKMDGIDYLSHAKMHYMATIEADLKNSIYTLGKNELKLNELQLVLNGSVSLLEEGINLVLTFKAPDNRFKSLLSMVPAVYTKDFESLTADGKMIVEGSVKGMYNEENLPAFNMNFLIKDGMFAYPGLPKSVNNINISANIKNKGGDADNTIIDISGFSVNLGGNPLTASLLIKTPVSDPDINAKVKGTLNLSSLKDFYPVDGELSGTFITDITLKGKLSSIEKERYDEFIALGSILVQNLNYNSPSLNKAVKISNAQLNFSPKYLDLVSFKTRIGESDLTANGKVTDYLAYLFKDGELKGKLTSQSGYFNLDELIPKEEVQESTSEEAAEKTETPATSSVIEIPDRIDFSINTSFDKLVYDSIEMTAVKGKVRIKNKVLKLNKLQMNAVKGRMILSGSYSAKNPKQPKVNLNFTLKGLDIPTAYNQFAVMRTYLPIAKKTSGLFSANFNISSNLNEQMMPVYESMNGAGQLNTSKITVNDLNTLLQIAEALKFNTLKKLELDKIAVKFQFIDGKMMVKPFDIRYKNIKANIGGWTSFNQSIAYVMRLDIPRKELGNSANQLMDKLLKEANKLGGNFSLPETISFDVLIGGTLSKPTVKTGLASGGNDLIKKAKEKVIKEISKEVKEKAQQILDEADKQAKAIIAEAEKQAKSLRKNADKAIAELNAETDKQAKKLMTEAKKQGLLAELAAGEAVKQLQKEADNQVQKLSKEADKQTDSIIKTAKQTAKKIKAEAKKKSDKLLEQ
jgi:vacuolar-type H+-ATPase subunit H